ncbi:SMP-30/gluconolactonase/LRE family protein [Dongia sedimenti]|uniref:SMP-30/gluconolactonase/LRE family protein n=1 Tax=Dongia sedimenti TaxID=3064282 RepID=A0ABU0YPW0_9PROT|nr:SMP-30/gluconolactonase/LRE family protein [Rhodospirillaceae bacterium R-7]
MRVVTDKLVYPEGPIAMDDGTVIVVDIADEALKRVLPNGDVECIARVPGGPNGAALGPDKQVYICNNGGLDWIEVQPGRLRPGPQNAGYLGGSIDVVDLADGSVTRLYDRCGQHALRGPNDIVMDGRGGFWFTDMGKRRDREMDLGAVYWAACDGSEIKEVIFGMISPNGLALSPDGGTLYVAETWTGRIWSWSIAGRGEVRKLEWPAPAGGTLYASPGGRARFDGLAMSQSGKVCAAALDLCAILEFGGSQRDCVVHALPDLLVTNLCFGGPDMQTCYVTLSHDPRLVALPWHEPGLKLQHAA